MHSTNDLDDDYFGSGYRIQASIKKYGRQNHILETIEWCSSRELLAQREKLIVNDELLKDEKCLNVVIGGNTTHHEYERSKISIFRQARSLKRFYTNIENRQRLSESVKKSYKHAVVRKNVSKKLNEKAVLEIRKIYSPMLHAEKITFEEVGMLYDVSGNTIWHIHTFKTWKYAGYSFETRT